MPKGIQGTVLIVRNEDTALSKSSTATIKACFPANPVGVEEPLTVNADRTASKLHQWYQTNVLDADVENSLFGGTVSMEYAKNGVPSFDEINSKYTKSGTEAYPASAWVPNPVSPGPGSLNPADKGPAPEGYGVTPTDSSNGVFATTTAGDPLQSSTRQAGATLGSYLLGKSGNSSST